MPSRVFQALYEFHSESENEIPLSCGEVVIVLNEVNVEWYEGIKENNTAGQFPASYVRCVFENVPKRLAIAVMSFHGEQDGDLTFEQGEVVGISNSLDQNWTEGFTNAQSGIFPVKFVRELHFSIGAEPPQADTPCGVVIENFQSQDIDELSICVGDCVQLSREIDGFWMEGVMNGKRGKFPKSFITVQSDLPDYLKFFENTKESETLPEAKAKAIYMFVGLKPEELSFDKGDIILLLERLNKDWLKGKIGKTVGIFPANHVEVLVDLPFKEEDNGKTTEVLKPRRMTNPPKFNNTLAFEDTNGHQFVKHANSVPESQGNKKSFSLGKAFSKPKISAKPKHMQKKERKAVMASSYEFEYTEEKIFDMHGQQSTVDVDHLKPNIEKKPRKSPVRPASSKHKDVGSHDKPQLNTLSKKEKKLPKPLAPSPAPKKHPRPNSLNLQNHYSTNNLPAESPDKCTVLLNSESVLFSSISRSETDPQLSKNKLITPDLPSSLHTASTPEKRSPQINSVLQRSASLRGMLPTETMSTPSSCQGSTDSISSNNQSQELKRVETEIVQLKSKIEYEAYQLSGVEVLLDFVTIDKQADLLLKQEHHNSTISELNEELNALEDEKSYLLASFGKLEDVYNRVAELEKQIEHYLDNCEQLRRMQDVAIAEELPEIRDNIEFCENMVDTLQDELNGLREKLGEFDQTDSVSDPETILEKRTTNQKRVIEELIKTEESYLRDITLVSEKIASELKKQCGEAFDSSVLFGNLDEIVALSANLLLQFKDAQDKPFNECPRNIATCFIGLSKEMKECYATYCRNYDDVQVLIEKYEDDTLLQQQISEVLQVFGVENGMFGLSAYLIKPVQRVLKYPLLLSELLKNTTEDGLGRKELKMALTTMTDVATAINEFKRRKDLVQKYRETEDGLTKKVQKFNWHSVAKKSSRINQRITQFTGLNSQTIDDTFIHEEKRFRSLEKIIKVVLKNISLFLESFKENSWSERQCSESLRQFYEGEQLPEEVIKYFGKIFMITEQYSKKMVAFITEHVQDPLTQLLHLFQGPFRLIQKRNDKCLDYDRAMNKAARAKDSKEKDRINQTQEELVASRNVYIALNTQLLEELPALSNKCSLFLQYAISTFVEANRRYLMNSYVHIKDLFKLPFITKDVDLLEHHHELIVKAAQQLTNLLFVPIVTAKERKLNNAPVPGLSKTNFFIGFNGQHEDRSLLLATSDDSLSPEVPVLMDSTDDIQLLDAPLSPQSEDPTGILQPSNQIDDIDVPDRMSPHDEYFAKFDFVGESDAEISVKEATAVHVVRKCDNNGNGEWWLVEQSGRQGYIPATFIEHRQSNGISAKRTLMDLADGCDNPGFLTSRLDLLEDVERKMSVESSLYVLEYDFEAINPGELTAREGQVVQVLRKEDLKGNTEWWLVEYDGQQGFVPEDYLCVHVKNS